MGHVNTEHEEEDENKFILFWVQRMLQLVMPQRNLSFGKVENLTLLFEKLLHQEH
jgi:hypothetical protein